MKCSLFRGAGFLLAVLLWGFTFPEPGSSIQSGGFGQDSSEVDLRLPDTESMAGYRDDPDFQYEEKSAPGESLLELLWFELIQFLDRLFGDGAGNTVLKSVMFLLLVAAVLLVLNRLLKGEIRAVLSGRSAEDPIQFTQDKDAGSPLDLDQQIREMADTKRYRQAVRLLYRKALHELNDSGLISWSVDKTNYDYLVEVSSHSVSEPLKGLTRIYDFVEYGDFGIDRNGYEQVQAFYEKIHKALKNERGLNS